MTPLRLIAPALTLSAFALALFGIDAWNRGAVRRTVFATYVALIGIVMSILLIPCVDPNAPIVYGRGLLISDGLSFALTLISLVTTLLVVLLTEQDRTMENKSLAVYYGMLLLSATGLVFAVTANDFLIIFLAIELVGIPAFIMTAYNRHSAKSGEAAIKFFLIGAFSSAMLAYGVSLLYGLLGSTSLSAISMNIPLLQEKAPITLLAIFLIVVSFGFKIAMVPFHMWVPDTFEGAPLPVAGYLSAAPKMAGIGLALRVFALTFPGSFHGSIELFAILAALTMTIANVVGLQQTNVVRLLAYSSIAHMGYVLLGLVAGGVEGLSSVYVYGIIYLFMNLGAFSVVILVNNVQQNVDLAAFAGLAKRAPALSALLVLFLISLAGLPPTAGFIAKFYVFAAAYKSGWYWLLAIAALNSVISVGYYFKILHAMYFKAPTTDTEIPVPFTGRVVLAVTSFATIFVGVAPHLTMTNARRLVQTPPAATETVTPSTNG